MLEVAFDFTKFAALVIPLQVICPRKIHAQNHFLSMILDSWIGTRIKKNWHIYDKKIFRKNIGTWKNILYLVGVGSQIPDSRKKESEWVLPEWLVYFPHSATTLASHASFPRTTVLQYSCLFWPGVSFATILSSSIISILSPAHTSFVKFRTLSCRNSNDLIVSSNTVRNKLPSRSSSHSPRTATSDAKVFFFFFFFHYALAAAGGFILLR